MAKKKKPQAAKNKFGSNPFNSLKGFAVSEQEQPMPEKKAVAKELSEEPYGSFADEMSLLGVKPLEGAEYGLEESAPLLDSVQVEQNLQPATNEEEEFLQALGEMDVQFSEKFPAEGSQQAASARRMKQLKQGKLSPQASLDLHGCMRDEVVSKLGFFLQDARHQGYTTLLVITGKGLHSAGGEAVLRQEAERYLAGAGRSMVVEWGRAPKRYGGEGALVLFLRK